MQYHFCVISGLCAAGVCEITLKPEGSLKAAGVTAGDYYRILVAE